MAHVDTAPPEAVPDQYKESVGKLHNQVLTIFQHRKIPYVIMAQMADDGYVGLETWLTVGLRLNALEQMLQQTSCFALKTGGESLHRPRQISSR